MKKGRLTQEELKRSLDMMAELKKRQGETLIQLGLIEPFELEDALKQQAREKFCELFSWRHGKYLFVPGKVFRKELTPIDLSVPQLCLRGVKEHYALVTLQDELARFVDVEPAVPPSAPFSMEEFKFATWDMKIVQQIRRKKTLNEILKLRSMREVDVYHLFFALRNLECLELPLPLNKERVKEVLEEDPIPASPFDLLGIKPSATDEDIRKAFEGKMKTLGKDPDANPEAKAIRDAFVQIGSFQGRRDYLIRKYEEEGELIPDARDVFKPDEIMAVGKRFLEKNELERASKVFMDGMTMFAEYGLFYTYLGWCLLKQSFAEKEDPEKLVRRARNAMLKGVQLDPMVDEAHLFMGRLFSFTEEYDHAQKAFQKTLDLNPENNEAASELRLVQMRMDKKKSTSFIRWKK